MVRMILAFVMIAPLSFASQFSNTAEAASPSGVHLSRLANLTEVFILVEDVSPDAREDGLTPENLRQELLVQLRAKLPRLRITETPENTLYLSLNYGKGRLGDRKVDYFGHLMLQVSRSVRLLATGEVIFAFVWQKVFLFTGPSHLGAGQVRAAIGELATQFATDYYEAGNR